jgi:hypothetical protein
MKRVYEIELERRDRWQAETYIVVAASDEEAIRKAKSRAAQQNDVKTGWRCISLKERSSELVG